MSNHKRKEVSHQAKEIKSSLIDFSDKLESIFKMDPIQNLLDES